MNSTFEKTNSELSIKKTGYVKLKRLFLSTITYRQMYLIFCPFDGPSIRTSFPLFPAAWSPYSPASARARARS